MRPVAAWLDALGIGVPSPAEVAQGGVALALTIAALAIGWGAGRRSGPWLTDQWQKRAGGHGAGMSRRLGKIMRHGIAALLLAVITNAWDWYPAPALGLGIALGAATAALAVEVLRGLRLPRWVAWLVALILVAGIVSNSIGGFAVTTGALERVGFNIGKRRLSLLSLATLIVTVVALYAVVRLANRVVSHSVAEARGFDPAQKLLAQKLAGIVILVAAFFLGVDLLDIDLTTFAVFSGGLGLAIGFGLQKTIGNLFAGIILLMDRSIKPGDVIVVGDSFGWVNKIGVRAVSVVTRDGKEHLIPNENLMTQEVENWSFTDRNVRVRIPVPVAYDCDIKLAQELMLRAAKDSPRVLTNPKPNVWTTGFGEIGVNHDILVWISDPESGVGNVKSDVLNRLWLLFKEHGIRVPMPQRIVTIREDARLAPPPADPTLPL